MNTSSPTRSPTVTAGKQTYSPVCVRGKEQGVFGEKQQFIEVSFTCMLPEVVLLQLIQLSTNQAENLRVSHQGNGSASLLTVLGELFFFLPTNTCFFQLFK